MDLMTLATICIDDPAHQRHTQALVQLASVVTDQNPWYVLDETTQQAIEARSLEQAAGVADALLRAGHVLRVGLALVPVHRAQAQGLPLHVLWDPCTNLALAAEYMELPERKAHRPSGMDRAVWQLAVYLSHEQPEDALSFAAQVLDAPPAPGQEFSLDATSRVRVSFPKNEPPVSPSIQIKLIAPPAHTPPSETSTELSQPRDADASPPEPAKRPGPIKASPSPLHQDAPKTPANKRSPQPPVTKEKLPLSTKPSP
jgi:hypothetical protein